VIGLWIIAPVSAQTEVECDDIAPPDVDATYYVGQGNAYFSQGNYALAVIAYTCGIDANPDYAPAYVSRGYAYAAQRDDPSALADYNRALELDESLVSAYNNRGMLYTSQGNFGLAITDFTLALALDPQYAIAYHNRAVVHAAEGNYDLAIADLQQAITLDPDSPAPHAALGAVYLAMAAASYQDYRDLAGANAAIPNGSANAMLTAVDDSIETGNFSAWLAFLTPAQ
jgi:tetratricopeptide (TPR) repeat protein